MLFRCVCPDISVFQPICLPLCAPPFYSIQALVVRFEADTERRKVGLPHRVTFLGRSLLEPEYTQTEEVQLNRQRHAVCTNAVFQLHVSNLISWMCFFLLLWKADLYGVSQYEKDTELNRHFFN